jgi:hypothetical protein
MGETPAQPVVGYVGYALKEPWGQPRAVIGFSADEAERLAEFLELGSADYGAPDRTALSRDAPGRDVPGREAPGRGLDLAQRHVPDQPAQSVEATEAKPDVLAVTSQ